MQLDVHAAYLRWIRTTKLGQGRYTRQVHINSAFRPRYCSVVVRDIQLALHVYFKEYYWTPSRGVGVGGGGQQGMALWLSPLIIMIFH